MLNFFVHFVDKFFVLDAVREYKRCTIIKVEKAFKIDIELILVLNELNKGMINFAKRRQIHIS